MLQPKSDHTSVTDPSLATQSSEAGTDTYVTFELAGQVFGTNVRHVREILDAQKITRLPNARHDCEGVINTRGASIPITDLGGRLGLGGAADGEDVRIIVFEFDFEGRMQPIAVKADRVLDVIRIADADIEDTPDGVTADGSAGAIRGLTRLGDELVVLIDIERVLGTNETLFA